MEVKQIFENYKLNTIENFFDFVNNRFCYGWIDKEGNKHQGINDANDYSLQSPNELLENNTGICWDVVELFRYFFEEMTDLKYETYYIFYDDNKGCPSHTILVYYKDKNVYWFEPLFKNDNEDITSGIIPYKNIKELLKEFKSSFINLCLKNKTIPDNYDKSNIYLYKYQKPNYHINGYEMRRHIEKGEKIILPERITLVSKFDKDTLDNFYNIYKCLNEELCKVPYGKNVDNRYQVDTLPTHFTISAWNIENEDQVLEQLDKIKFPSLNIKVIDIKVMNGNENSYVLYFDIEENEKLRLLQKEVYNILPSKKYNPENFAFHITIHIDKNYDKIIAVQKNLKEQFKPFEIIVKEYGLYEIYPANIIQKY